MSTSTNMLNENENHDQRSKNDHNSHKKEMRTPFLHRIADITHPITASRDLCCCHLVTSRASGNIERLLQERRMNSSAEDSPEVLEASNGSNGSLPLFVLLWIACLSFTWFVLRCLYYCNRRRTIEVAILVVVAGGLPLKTITEVERRKTLIVHHFQINQVTIVRNCACGIFVWNVVLY
jgi:hypothetical protein